MSSLCFHVSVVVSFLFFEFSTVIWWWNARLQTLRIASRDGAYAALTLAGTHITNSPPDLLWYQLGPQEMPSNMAETNNLLLVLVRLAVLGMVGRRG